MVDNVTHMKSAFTILASAAVELLLDGLGGHFSEAGHGRWGGEGGCGRGLQGVSRFSGFLPSFIG